VERPAPGGSLSVIARVFRAFQTFRDWPRLMLVQDGLKEKMRMTKYSAPWCPSSLVFLVAVVRVQILVADNS